MNINYFQDQYDMVNECKDPEVKKMQLEILANNMEQTYNIPANSNEKYVQENPYVMQLYKKVKTSIENTISLIEKRKREIERLKDFMKKYA